MSRVDELARESVAAELVRLRTENDWLRSSAASQSETARADIAKLQGEVERLRAALQQIVAGADTGWSAIGIARRALGDAPPFYECPDCGRDIANSTHTAECSRNARRGSWG